MNDVQLKRILHAVQLPAKDRSFAVLVTKENLIACGLLLPPSRPPRQIAPATPRPSSTTTMKLPPTKKRLGDAPSTSAAVQPAKKKKTVRQEDDVVVVAPPTSVPVQSPVRAPAQASQRTFQEALCFPGSQVYNTSFLVPDVPDARIPQMLALPPRFSLPFEAIYSSFHQDDFEAARRQPLIERAREMVQLNLKVRFTLEFLVFLVLFLFIIFSLPLFFFF